MIRSAPAMGRMVRVVALNTLTAALFALLQGLQFGWAAMVSGILVSAIYANVIGTAAHFVLPNAIARLGCRGGARYWLGIVGALSALAVTGALVAGVLSAALGLFGRGPWWPPLLRGVGIAVVLTLGFSSNGFFGSQGLQSGASAHPAYLQSMDYERQLMRQQIERSNGTRMNVAV